jgi:hypothetical protein
MKASSSNERICYGDVQWCHWKDTGRQHNISQLAKYDTRKHKSEQIEEDRSLRELRPTAIWQLSQGCHFFGMTVMPVAERFPRFERNIESHDIGETGIVCIPFL